MNKSVEHPETGVENPCAEFCGPAVDAGWAALRAHVEGLLASHIPTVVDDEVHAVVGGATSRHRGRSDPSCVTDLATRSASFTDWRSPGDTDRPEDVWAIPPRSLDAQAPASVRFRVPAAARRGSRRRNITAIIALLGGTWLCVAVTHLGRVWERFEQGAAAIARIEGDAPGAVLTGRGERDIEAARKSLEAVSQDLDSPVLAPMRVIPVLGGELRAAQALASGSVTLLDSGVNLIADVRHGLARLQDPKADRVVTLRSLAREFDVAERAATTSNLGPSRSFLGKLDTIRTRTAQARDEAKARLAAASAALTAAAEILEGPQRYLILAANNAEMRSGTGMFLQAGVLTAKGGDLDLGPFVPTADKYVGTIELPMERDLGARWGWLSPNREWRNLAVTPRFPASATLAASMWEATGGGHVDGVLALDVEGVRSLLQATGPVTVNGEEVNAENAQAFLLYDQYLRFADDPSQQSRREALGELTAQLVAKFKAGSFEPAELVSSLASAARGRHLVVWSIHSAHQTAWEASEISGDVAPDSLLLALVNRGGNKLDRFISVAPRIAVKPSEDYTDVTVDIPLENTTPDGAPPYVAGPQPGSGVGAGDYVGVLALTVPGRAFDLRLSGDEDVAVIGNDGPTKVIGKQIVIRQGEARTFVLSFRLPRSSGSLRVEPSARVPGLVWSDGHESWSDDGPHTITW